MVGATTASAGRCNVTSCDHLVGQRALAPSPTSGTASRNGGRKFGRRQAPAIPRAVQTPIHRANLAFTVPKMCPLGVTPGFVVRRSSALEAQGAVRGVNV